MTKISTAEAQRNNAEQQLFGARRALAHLVEATTAAGAPTTRKTRLPKQPARRDRRSNIGRRSPPRAAAVPARHDSAAPIGRAQTGVSSATHRAVIIANCDAAAE
jgi:outer membrane protein TolC